MEPAKFPIRVDLSAFFTDERKQVMVMVDPGWETIGELQMALKSRFGIPVNPAIMSGDGYFLPASESIMLASHVDKLKAFVPTLTNYGPTASLEEMQTTLSHHTVSADLSSSKLRKKRKFSALKESNPDTEGHKRSKTLDFLGSNQAADKQRSAFSLDNVHLATQTESPGEKKHKKQKQKHKEDTQIDEEETEAKNVAKEKSKKKNKQKKAKESLGENTLASITGQTSSGTLQNSHVFFDDQEAPLNATATSLPANVVFVCALAEAKMEKPRIIDVGRRKKILLEIKENIQLLPPRDQTAMYTNFSKPQDADIQNSTALHGDTSMGGDKSAAELENTSAMESTIRENDAVSSAGLEDISCLPAVEETSTVSTMVERMDTDTSLPCDVTQAERTIADDVTQAERTATDELDDEEPTESVIALDECTDDENTMDESTVHKSAANKSGANKSAVQKSAVGDTAVDDGAVDDSTVVDDGAVDDSVMDESTVISEDDDVIELSDNDTNQEVEPKASNTSQISWDMPGMPEVGDTILFKLKTRCGKFVTKFMQAKCVHLLKRSKSVKLDVTGKRGELSRIDEKYFDKTMLDSSGPSTRLLVKWNEVIEPKILLQ